MVLRELEYRCAIGPLIAALKDEDEDAQTYAARALGDLGDTRAVGPLEELLGDESAGVREAATTALAELRGQSRGKP